jgi:hypothetical protein
VKLPNLKIEAIKDNNPHLIATEDNVGSIATTSVITSLASIQEKSSYVEYTYTNEWGPLSSIYKLKSPD